MADDNNTEEVMNTTRVNRFQANDEKIVFDVALTEMYSHHNLPPQEVEKMRQKWNRKARQWARIQSTTEGHAKKVYHGGQWKNVLPRSETRKILPSIVRVAVERQETSELNEIAVIQARMAMYQAQVQARMNALQAFRQLITQTDQDEEGLKMCKTVTDK